MVNLGIFSNDTKVYDAIRNGNLGDTLTISFHDTDLSMPEGRYQIVKASDKDAKFPAGRGYDNDDEYVELRALKGIKQIDGGAKRSAKSIGKKRRSKKSSSKKSQKKRSRANRKGRKTRRH